MASLDEVRAVVAEEIKKAEDRQNTWTRSEIDKAVVSIKENAAVLRNGLAKLVRAFAAKMGVTDI